MDIREKVAPAPIRMSTDRGTWNCGSAGCKLGGMLIASRGNGSSGTNSAIFGIIRKLNFLWKLLWKDRKLISTHFLDNVNIPLIAPTGIEHICVGTLSNCDNLFVTKCAVEHVSSNARAVTKLPWTSWTRMMTRSSLIVALYHATRCSMHVVWVTIVPLIQF